MSNGLLDLFDAAWDHVPSDDAEELSECQAHDDALAAFEAALASEVEGLRAALAFKRGLIEDIGASCERAEARVAAVAALADEWEQRVQDVPAAWIGQSATYMAAVKSLRAILAGEGDA